MELAAHGLAAPPRQRQDGGMVKQAKPRGGPRPGSGRPPAAKTRWKATAKAAGEDAADAELARATYREALLMPLATMTADKAMTAGAAMRLRMTAAAGLAALAGAKVAARKADPPRAALPVKFAVMTERDARQAGLDDAEIEAARREGFSLPDRDEDGELIPDAAARNGAEHRRTSDG